MNIDNLIELGNNFREQRQPDEALKCYAQAFVDDFNSAAAWNNYGNVIREMGHPDRAIPFLENALRIVPNYPTARFNLAVSQLLMGDYERGWVSYESRWEYEHLSGTLPNFDKPRWQGEDIKNKTVLIIGEQGLGDCIQFVRFVVAIHQLGGRAILQLPNTIVPLFGTNDIISEVKGFGESVGEFDYWTPMMSLPRILGVTLDKMYSPLHYIEASPVLINEWHNRLGKKLKLRVGIAWSGRRDTWINKHKAVPFELIEDMIRRNPQYQWTNLQVDATTEESARLEAVGCKTYPGTIANMADSAALIFNMDVVVGVDTAVSHLAAALARPTWIMLNQYALDWRWLLNRNDSPWYPTARLFRQPKMDDWGSAITQVERHLDLFKI
jgi:hypothetical protein